MDTNRTFQNTPLTDFTNASERSRFAAAVQETEGLFPIRVRPCVDGAYVNGAETIQRENPSATDQIVATIECASASEASDAVEGALDAWPDWRDSPVEDRAAMLERLGTLLDEHRFELAALQVHEVGKPWKEADADVAEAIDFCRFYAARARVELALHALGSVPGERNEGWYEGRGVAAIIAPWNFPTAILTGMTTAALVAGNTLIIKPAEQSSAVAGRFFELLGGTGIPSGAAHFLPGIGETVGAALVAHPDVSTIAFTGSRAVGLKIVEQAGRTASGQRQVKRVICEMGGKNAIVVDSDADLDEAIEGVVKSAFGYAGQKCSACSRAIVHAAVYDEFRDRLVEAIKSLHVARADDPECQVGPVVDADAFDRLIGVVDAPGDGAVCLYRGEARDGGYYVPPSLFEVQDARHPLMQVEHFGPILGMVRCGDFDEGIAMANATEYALTGGIYTRNPDHVTYAKRRFRVGNLYVNRGITGAFVNRQPFGGFGMSGIGTKAGGAGYLLHYADPRTATENTMRHGFTPDLE